MGIGHEAARVTADLESVAHHHTTIRVASEVDQIIDIVGALDGTTYEMVAVVVLAVRRLQQRGEM